MVERRKTQRSRVIYGGVLSYNDRRSTVNCVIRNFSNDGARVEFENPAFLPEKIELFVARKERELTAQIVWRRDADAGLSFCSTGTNDPIPLDWARRLRVSETERRRLQARLDQLLSEH
jgi:hypothetical protein